MKTEGHSKYLMSYDMKEAFRGADVVYPKSWTSIEYLPPKRSTPDLDGVRRLIDKNKSWIGLGVRQRRMLATRNTTRDTNRKVRSANLEK